MNLDQLFAELDREAERRKAAKTAALSAVPADPVSLAEKPTHGPERAENGGPDGQ